MSFLEEFNSIRTSLLLHSKKKLLSVCEWLNRSSMSLLPTNQKTITNPWTRLLYVCMWVCADEIWAQPQESARWADQRTS